MEDAIGVEEMVRIRQSIIADMEPHEMMKALAAMMPAMNIDDRTELLGGMKADAPEPAFAAVWNLAGSVLTPNDLQAVARRPRDQTELDNSVLPKWASVGEGPPESTSIPPWQRRR